MCSVSVRALGCSRVQLVVPAKYYTCCMLSAGRRACRRVCWGGAGECSCGAPAAARRLPARVWRADTRGLISRGSHRMKASAGSTRPTQSPSRVNPTHTEPQPDTAGGKQHRGETAHGETHPPTAPIIGGVSGLGGWFQGFGLIRVFSG